MTDEADRILWTLYDISRISPFYAMDGIELSKMVGSNADDVEKILNNPRFSMLWFYIIGFGWVVSETGKMVVELEGLDGFIKRQV